MTASNDLSPTSKEFFQEWLAMERRFLWQARAFQGLFYLLCAGYGSLIGLAAHREHWWMIPILGAMAAFVVHKGIGPNLEWQRETQNTIDNLEEVVEHGYVLLDHPDNNAFWCYFPPRIGICWVCDEPTRWIHLDIAFQHPDCDWYPSDRGHVRIIRGQEVNYAAPNQTPDSGRDA